MDRLILEKDRTDSGNLNLALDQAAPGSDDFLSGELTVAQIHSISSSSGVGSPGPAPGPGPAPAPAPAASKAASSNRISAGRPTKVASSSAERTTVQTTGNKKTPQGSSPGAVPGAGMTVSTPGEVKKTRKQSPPLPRVATLAKPPPPKTTAEERQRKRASPKTRSAGGLRSMKQPNVSQRPNDRALVQSPLGRPASVGRPNSAVKSSIPPPSRPSSSSSSSSKLRLTPPGSAGLSRSFSGAKHINDGSPAPTPVQESSTTRVQKVLDEAEEEVSAIKRALGLDTSLDTNEMQGNVVEEQTPHVKMAEVVASAKEPVPVTEFPEKKVTPTVGGVKQDQKVMTKFDVAKEEKAAAGCCCCVM